MNLRVRLDSRWLELEFLRDGDACRFRVRSDGADSGPRTASLLEVEPGIYSVLLDGRSYEVRVEPGQEGGFVALAGRRFAFEVADPRQSRQKPRGPFAVERMSVRSPMPGRVVRVLVAEGEAVESGQGLAVVEAMKMQNELKAPRAGRVTDLRARAGAAVTADEVLAIIE